MIFTKKYNMKLTKENVYIDLRGKSKEELTELWEFLNNAGEKQLRDSLNDFLVNCNGWVIYEFSRTQWVLSSGRISLYEKTEVTIEQLKEILQPMENKGEQLRKEAKERGYTYDNFKCLINKVLEGVEDINKWYYSDVHDSLYTMPEDMGGNVVYRDGVWAEIVTLEQQLQKAEAEVKRLRKEIEEENKPKIGDWVVNIKGMVYKYDGNDLVHKYKKITNPELIKLLEQEMN